MPRARGHARFLARGCAPHLAQKPAHPAGLPSYIAALEDSGWLVIGREQLQQLYAQSHGWERCGHLLAEQHLFFDQSRTESLLLQSAEQRYLALLAQLPGITNRVA